MLTVNAKARLFIQCLPASREYGFNDLCVLTHAWHESGGFQRVIGDFNFWGIKVPQRTPWNGKTVPVFTTEYEAMVPGEDPDQAMIRAEKKYGCSIHSIARYGIKWRLKLMQQFIDFPTCEQAILWYCDFIQRLYPLAFKNQQDLSKYFYGLCGQEVVEESHSCSSKDSFIKGKGNLEIVKILEWSESRVKYVVQIPGKLKYATDPNYVSALNSLARDLGKAPALSALLSKP